ncbi:unnamed protein product, partial [Rotaria magnacalcarata]
MCLTFMHAPRYIIQ